MRPRGGLVCSVERPVYDDLMAEQIATAQAGEEGELTSLLGGGDTWEIG